MLSFLREVFAELPAVLAFDRLCRSAGVQDSGQSAIADACDTLERDMDCLLGRSPEERTRERALDAKRRELDQLEEALRLKEREQALLERKRQLEARLSQP